MESDVKKTGSGLESSPQCCSGARVVERGPHHHVGDPSEPDRGNQCVDDLRHGRDNKLIVWQLGAFEENAMSTVLPVDAPAASTIQPWLLHMLTVNTLNFCSFAMCVDEMPQPALAGPAMEDTTTPKPILFAVPNTVDSGGIDIYQLPSETRAAVINADRNITTGMVMALSILAESTRLQIAAGYESGHTMVYVQNDPGATFQRLYSARPHSQPVLSMAIHPSRDYYMTSSADAILAKHPLPTAKGIWNTDLKPFKLSQTKHSGQQGLRIRSDGKIFATAGWDARVRVYSAKTMNELAVLKWHKVGCYATAFAAVDPPAPNETCQRVLEDDEKNTPILPESGVTATVQKRREEQAQSTHWLAAGSKDGKVSLWDIY